MTSHSTFSNLSEYFYNLPYAHCGQKALALYATFVGLVGYIYETFEDLELASLALLAFIAFFLGVMIVALYFMILKKINELEDL